MTVCNLLLFFFLLLSYMLSGFAFPGGGAWYDALTKLPGTPPNLVLPIV